MNALNFFIPSKFDKSDTNGIHSVSNLSESSLALSSNASSFLAVIYTFALFAKKPDAIISPIPLEPPVTIPTLSLTEKRFSRLRFIKSLPKMLQQQPHK